MSSYHSIHPPTYFVQRCFLCGLVLTFDLWAVLIVGLHRYEGQFDGGKCHGRGTYFYANGNR